MQEKTNNIKIGGTSLRAAPTQLIFSLLKQQALCTFSFSLIAKVVTHIHYRKFNHIQI